MIQEILVSIIVPVYNVEAYLKRCLESLITQKHQNIEILLIDDGSTDESLKICNQYVKIDERIKVYHKENGGLSSARNYGIKRAKGDYYAFVDSDDWVHSEYISRMLLIAIEYKCDIVQSNYREVYEQEEEDAYSNELISEVDILTGKEANLQSYEGKVKFITCNNLYRKELFKTLLFPEGKLHEDTFLIYKLFWKAQRIGVIQDVLYFYFQRHNSIMHQYSIKRLDAIEALKQRCDFYQVNEEMELYDKARFEYCIFISDEIYKIYASDIHEKEEIVVELKRELKKTSFELLFSKIVPIKKKISLVLNVWVYPVKKMLKYLKNRTLLCSKK